MKKILFLLLCSVVMYGQVPADATPLENIQITNNTTDNSATKVVVQSASNVLNTIAKNDVIEYLEFASAVNLPVTGVAGKLYLTRDNNRLYRWNGTIYVDVTADISGKENSANKQNSLAVDGTGVKFPTVDAVNTGLSTKISGTGTTNFIPKFTGSGTVENSRLFDDGVNIGTNSGNAFLVGDLGSDNYFRLIAVPSGSFIQYATGNATGGRGTLSFTGLNGSNTTLSLLPSGRVLFNGATDNLIDAVQINGNITASPATLPNQVVVKSQLDLKANDSVVVKLTGGQLIQGTKQFNNSTTGNGILSTNTATGVGIAANNASSGIAFRALGQSTGNNIVSNLDVSGTGFAYVGQNNGTNTFTVDKFGNIVGNTYTGGALLTGTPTAPTATAGTANTQIANTLFVNQNTVTLTGTQIITGTKQFTSPTGGNGIFSLNNSTSNGIELSNTSTGTAVKSVSSSSGSNVVSNHTGTGLNYVGQNNGTNTFTVDKFGAITSNSLAGTGTRLVNASPTGQLGAISTLPVFADNIAAIAGGLGVGALYRTVIGLLAIVF